MRKPLSSRRFLTSCFFSLFTFLMPSFSMGQATTAAGYYFKATNGTFSYLSGGTDLSSIEVDDGMSSSISLGFTFRYCGTDYTSAYISSNGWISFTSSYAYGYPGSTTYLGSTYLGKGVMPLWDDVSGDAGNASYTTTGSSPNRVFIMEWRDWKWDYSASSAGISFQVKLYETTNMIQFLYKQESGALAFDYTLGATIGLSGGTTTDYLSLDNVSTSPTASSSTFTNTITNKPATGQIYQFSPIPECAGRPLAGLLSGPAVAVCPGANFTLAQLSAYVAIGATFRWQSSPAGAGTFSDISGATNNTLTTSTTANTDYRLIINCSISGQSDTSGVRTVNVVAKPAVTANGPTTFCSNQNLTLSTTPVSGISYQWKNASGTITGATSNFYSPTATGKYIVVASTTLCSGVSSDSTDVTVKAAPTATITPGTSATFCTGGNVLLTGGGTGTYQWRNSAGDIAGATSATYNASVASTYTLVVTNTTTGCSDTSDPTIVVSSPAPTASIAPAGGSPAICTGYSFTLNSTTTGSGLTYQWYNGTTAITGATTSSYTGVATAASDYSLKVFAGTCSATSNIVSITLNPLPPATITSIGATTAVCAGGDVRLQANTGPGYIYQWELGGSNIPGASALVYTVPVAGTYTVKVTDVNNCTSTSAPVDIVNSIMTKPNVTPKDVSFCEGASIMLFGNPDTSALSFQWRKDGTDIPWDTAKTHIAKLTGRYAVTVIDKYNCRITSDEVTVTVRPLPAKPVIVKSGSLLSTTSLYATYQWYRNGHILAGANSRTYSYIYDGNYSVVVGDANDCHNTSDILVIDATGVEEPTDDIAKIWPNPARDRVFIEAPVPVNVIIKDIQGRVLLEAGNAKEIDVSGYAAGIYFFVISDKENNVLGAGKLLLSK